MFTPKIGEDEPILTVRIFFRWVVQKTTNQLKHGFSIGWVKGMVVTFFFFGGEVSFRKAAAASTWRIIPVSK